MDSVEREQERRIYVGTVVAFLCGILSMYMARLYKGYKMHGWVRLHVVSMYTSMVLLLVQFVTSTNGTILPSKQHQNELYIGIVILFYVLSGIICQSAYNRYVKKRECKSEQYIDLYKQKRCLNVPICVVSLIMLACITLSSLRWNDVHVYILLSGLVVCMAIRMSITIYQGHGI